MDVFVEAYRPFCDYNGLSVDIARCDLRGIGELAELFHNFAAYLNSNLAQVDENIRLRIEDQLLTAHNHCQTYLLQQCVDISDFLTGFHQRIESSGLIEALPQLRDKVASVTDLISKISLSKSIGNEFQFSNGLSLYLPWSYFSYLLTRNQYLELDFGSDPRSKPSDWTSFLDNYLYSTLRDDGADTWKTLLSEMSTLEVTAATAANSAVAGLANNKALNLANIKVNPLTTRVNPLNTRVNPLTTRVLAQTQLENFRRTQNFPWMSEKAVRILFQRKAQK